MFPVGVPFQASVGTVQVVPGEQPPRNQEEAQVKSRAVKIEENLEKDFI